jgi:hypothetical protein
MASHAPATTPNSQFEEELASLHIAAAGSDATATVLVRLLTISPVSSDTRTSPLLESLLSAFSRVPALDSALALATFLLDNEPSTSTYFLVRPTDINNWTQVSSGLGRSNDELA